MSLILLLRLHDSEKYRPIREEFAVRGYQEVADEFYRRTGIRISKASVWVHLVNAHRKIAKELKRMIE